MPEPRCCWPTRPRRLLAATSSISAAAGPIALSTALESPHATVWAVDVNERALDLVRRNARTLGLDNVNACRPEDVPGDIAFMTIRSNPPIRVGKNELHKMLELWLPRLDPGADARLVRTEGHTAE